MFKTYLCLEDREEKMLQVLMMITQLNTQQNLQIWLFQKQYLSTTDNKRWSNLTTDDLHQEYFIGWTISYRLTLLLTRINTLNIDFQSMYKSAVYTTLP